MCLGRADTRVNFCKMGRRIQISQGNVLPFVTLNTETWKNGPEQMAQKCCV